MIHPKQHIVDMVEIFFQKGISNIIISPGSRNAPLIEAFLKRFGKKCISIVDERSAGYVALGIARYSQLPVILICTSGTATINFGPALAEAFHQQIPLIALTADRPVEWINQLDNQTLRQKHIYTNFVKASYNFPQAFVDQNDLWFVHRIVNEAYNTSISDSSGPVHINIPLCEPLYGQLPEVQDGIKIVNRAEIAVSIKLAPELIAIWNKAERILIVHGQDVPSSEVSSYLDIISSDTRVTIIAENISNVKISRRIESPDILLSNPDKVNHLKPDLLIISGLQVVSKRLKSFLRKAGNMQCWRIGAEQNIIDTYQQVNTILNYKAEIVYKELMNYISNDTSFNYQAKWFEVKDIAEQNRLQVLENIPFSDAKAMERILQSIPSDSILELGNSSVIRYSQLFNCRNDHTYLSNRGVSGIDGCLSSAVGTALSSEKLTVAVVGDLSFVYDSNALWNRELPSNLRIIVINNKGGGIFRLIDGPATNPSFEEFVNAYHPVDLKKLSEAFGITYLQAADKNELNDAFELFYQESDKPKLLEINTSAEISANSYKKILGINN